MSGSKEIPGQQPEPQQTRNEQVDTHVHDIPDERHAVDLWQAGTVREQTDDILPSARNWITGQDAQPYFQGSLRAEIFETLAGGGLASTFDARAITTAYDQAANDPQAQAQIQSHLRQEVFRQLAERLLLRDEDFVEGGQIHTRERSLYFDRLTNETVGPESYWFHTYREEQKQKVDGQKQPVNFNDEYYPQTQEAKDRLTKAPTRNGLLLPMAYAIYQGDEEGQNVGVIGELVFPFVGTSADELQQQIDTTLQAISEPKLFADVVVTIVVPTNPDTERAANTLMNEWPDRLDAATIYPKMQVRYITLPIFPDEIDRRVARFGGPQPLTEEQTTPEASELQQESGPDTTATPTEAVQPEPEERIEEREATEEEEKPQPETPTPAEEKVIYVTPKQKTRHKGQQRTPDKAGKRQKPTELQPPMQEQQTQEQEQKEPIPSVIEQAYQYFRSHEAFAQTKDPEQLWRYIKMLAGEYVTIVKVDEELIDKTTGETQVTGEPAILAVAQHIGESLREQLGPGNARIYKWASAVQANLDHVDITPRIESVEGNTLMMDYLIDSREKQATDITQHELFPRIQQAASKATGLSRETLSQIETDITRLREQGPTETIYPTEPQIILGIMGTNLKQKDYPPVLRQELFDLLPKDARFIPLPDISKQESDKIRVNESLRIIAYETMPTLLKAGATPEEIDTVILPQVKAFIIELEREYNEITTNTAKVLVNEIKDHTQTPAEHGSIIITPAWNDVMHRLPEAIRDQAEIRNLQSAIHIAPFADRNPIRKSYMAELLQQTTDRYTPETISRYSQELTAIANGPTEQAPLAAALLKVAADEKQLKRLRNGIRANISETESITREQADTVLFDLILKESVLKKALLSEALALTYHVTLSELTVTNFDEEIKNARELASLLNTEDMYTLLAPPEIRDAATIEQEIKQAQKRAGTKQQEANRATGNKRKQLQEEAKLAAKEVSRLTTEKTTLQKQVGPAGRIMAEIAKHVKLENPDEESFSGGEQAPKYQEAKRKALQDSHFPMPDPEDYIGSDEHYPLAYIRAKQMVTALSELEHNRLVVTEGISADELKRRAQQAKEDRTFLERYKRQSK